MVRIHEDATLVRREPEVAIFLLVVTPYSVRNNSRTHEKSPVS